MSCATVDGGGPRGGRYRWCGWVVRAIKTIIRSRRKYTSHEYVQVRLFIQLLSLVPGTILTLIHDSATIPKELIVQDEDLSFVYDRVLV
jgi:hypothetical protein